MELADSIPAVPGSHSDPRQVVRTRGCAIKQYKLVPANGRPNKAEKVTAGLAESNGSLLSGL